MQEPRVNNVVDKMAQERKEREAYSEEQAKQLAIACKDLFSSANGIHFGKWLHNYCMQGNQRRTDDINNPYALVYYRALTDLYEELKPALPEAARIAIEIKE